MNNKNIFASPAFWFAVGMLAMYAMGVALRRHVLEAQYSRHGRDMRFTLESALQYRLVKQARDGSIPRHDHRIQYPDGVSPHRIYSIGQEYVYAPLSRMWPRAALPDAVRWVQLLWFALAIPITGMWIRETSGSRLGGLVGAALLAGGVAAVVRSTGQEISRENFAFPLFVGWLWMQQRSRRAPPGSPGLLPAAIGAALLALAWCFWDMVQFLIALRLLHMGGAMLRARNDTVAARRWHVTGVLEWGALSLAALLNPYLLAHGAWQSPLLLLGWSWLGVSAVHHRLRPAAPTWRRRLLLWALALLPLALLWLEPFRGHYGHFMELFWAKLRFYNSKPPDPGVLTFAQRIMWTPALHSADFQLTRHIFPGMLLLTALAAGFLFLSNRSGKYSSFYYPLFYCAAAWLLYVFFVRFYVFVALFNAAVAGCAVAVAVRRVRLAAAIAVVLCLAALTAEVRAVWREPQKWGRELAYYQEDGELLEWMRKNAAGEPVLANFGISASLLTYADCPIVLHPKFEKADIRQRVRGYGEALFLGTEMMFREWAEKYGPQYYVYARGEFSQRQPELQMRYFVDALDPPEYAAARLFEFRPREGRYFIYLWGNRKYRVFRILTRADEQHAEETAIAAEVYLRHGDLLGAERIADRALRKNPYNRRAMQVLSTVDAKRDRGNASESNNRQE